MYSPNTLCGLQPFSASNWGTNPKGSGDGFDLQSHQEADEHSRPRARVYSARAPKEGPSNDKECQ